MTMEFCIDAAQLRAALDEIEAAEKNGFHHCLAVFKFSHAGYMLSDCRATYSDLLERAHPFDASLDWGRFQRVTARHRFEDGKLMPLSASPQPQTGGAEGVPTVHLRVTPCKHCGARQGEEHSVTCPYGVGGTDASR